MFRKFLKSKLKKVTEEKKAEKPVKKIVKEEKTKEVIKEKEVVKEKVKLQPVINKLLTAEGWLRRQKKS